MIVISRKEIFSVIKFVLILIGVALISLALGVLEGWVIHKYFPDAMDDPWFWYYYTQTFSPDEEGYSIYVDLDTMQLTLYESGEAIKTYPVSGGGKATPSPLGQWKVTEVGDWGSGFGGSWIAINCPWGQYGIHGTIEPWVVGRSNSSHGCIRMKNKDAAELKEYVKWGTVVYIKYDNAPFRAVKDGDRGSDVLYVQEMLMLLGYMDGPPDGRFGSSTKKAIEKFQRDNGIQADGIAGVTTYQLLMELCE